MREKGRTIEVSEVQLPCLSCFTARKRQTWATEFYTLRSAVSQPVKTAKHSCGFSLQRRPVFFFVVELFPTARAVKWADRQPRLSRRSGTVEKQDDEGFEFLFLFWGAKMQETVWLQSSQQYQAKIRIQRENNFPKWKKNKTIKTLSLSLFFSRDWLRGFKRRVKAWLRENRSVTATAGSPSKNSLAFYVSEAETWIRSWQGLWQTGTHTYTLKRF